MPNVARKPKLAKTGKGIAKKTEKGGKTMSTIETQVLKAAMKATGYSLGKGADILQYVKMEQYNNSLTFTTHDLETSLTYHATIKYSDAQKEFTLCIPHKLLKTFAENIDTDIVNFHAIEGSDQPVLDIIAGKTHPKFKGTDSTDFPPNIVNAQIDAEPIVMNCAVLRTMLEEVKMCASRDTDRATFNAILMHIRGNIMTLAAADTYRLAVRSDKVIAADSPELLIPLNTVNKLLSTMPKDGEINILYNTNTISFSYGCIELESRLREGKFPDFERIIPRNHTTSAIIETNDILRGARILRKFQYASNNGYDNATKFIFSKNKATMLYTNEDMGEIARECESIHTGIDNEIKLNLVYVDEIISGIDTSHSITMKLSDPNQPIVIEPSGRDNLIYVVMPLYSRN